MLAAFAANNRLHTRSTRASVPSWRIVLPQDAAEIRGCVFNCAAVSRRRHLIQQVVQANEAFILLRQQLANTHCTPYVQALLGRAAPAG